MSKSMKIDKAALQEALTVVKPGLAAKALIEQSTSFAFIGERVVTYNDVISISHPVEGVALEGAIEATELYSLLSKIGSDTITMEDPKDGSLLLKAGKSRAGFTLQKEIKLPLDEITLEGDWEKLPKDFVIAVRKVMPAASGDMSRPVLTCVNISNKGFIEASDAVRASRYKIKKAKFKPFLLPTSAAIPLIRISPTHVLVSGGWIHFKNEVGTIFSSRSMEGDFPDLNSLLSMGGDELVKFPKELTGIVNRAEPFYKRPHILQESITILIKDGELTVKATADNSNSWFKESLKSKGIPDMAFNIPPSLLLDILSVEAEVKIKDRYLSFTHDNWSYLCCTNVL